MACLRCRAQFEGSPNYCPECGLSKAEAAELNRPQPAPDAAPGPGERFGIRTSDRRPPEPTEKASGAWGVWKSVPWPLKILAVVLALIVLGAVAGDDRDTQNPVIDRDTIDLDETRSQQRIVDRCDAQLDDFYASGNTGQAEQLEFYQDCLRDNGYVEAGQ